MPEEDTVAVDVVSADQLSHAMAGMKTGKKENPKPLVEKVAEAKPPVDDAVGKITEKAAGRHRHHAAAATQARRKAGREKTRSAEAGGRSQAEGRAEAGREKT